MLGKIPLQMEGWGQEPVGFGPLLADGGLWDGELLFRLRSLA